MKEPKILKVLNTSLIIASILVLISFLIPIVPCKTASLSADITYSWGVCKIQNPFVDQITGTSQKFYGAYTEPLAGFIIQFGVLFIISTLIFLGSKKKHKQVLDLTEDLAENISKVK